MTEYPTSFADYPKSVTEIKADNMADPGAQDWTPRDAVIATLREIDAPTTRIDAVVVIYRQRHNDGSTTTSFMQATPDTHVGAGMCAHIVHKLFQE